VWIALLDALRPAEYVRASALQADCGVLGPILCMDEKLALLQANCADHSSSTALWSLHDFDRVKGSLYSSATCHLRCWLRIRVSQMQCLMGLQARGGPDEPLLPHPFAPTV
jgi:hypothetical protein